VFKQFLTGSCISLFLLVGNLSVQAQQKPISPSPSSAPQSQPPASNTPTNTQISSDELQKFARTIKQLIGITESANQEMSQVVSKSGLSQQRFIAIHKSQSTPSATKPTPAVTSQEKQQYEKAFASLRQIQQQADTKMQQVLQAEGLQIDRFNQIEAAVRQDPALQKRVRDMIKG
jgi:LAS superfamily LD-carboxypeptidase LdcB